MAGQEIKQRECATIVCSMCAIQADFSGWCMSHAHCLTICCFFLNSLKLTIMHHFALLAMA